MIRIRNLAKNYGGFQAVKKLDLDIQPGEIFGFLGPNGAGKTTTISMLTGLLKPSQGEVFLKGLDLQKRPVEAKRVFGYVPDTPVLYEKLTLMEFMKFIQEIYRLDSVESKDRLERLLELFELEEKMDALIGSFSRGMRQKAAIISALLPEPDILILDEPTNGLDPKAVKRLKDLLLDETKRGVTVFMSTHILEIAEKMSHRIGIIREGELVAIGTMSEIRQLRNEDTSRHHAGDLEGLFLELTGGDTYAHLD